MIKTEIICQNCDVQYIVVTKEKEPISYCPFCATPFDEDDLDKLDDDENIDNKE